MSRKRELSARAESFAAGRVRNGDNAVFEHGALSDGWNKGYRAAVSEVRRILNMQGGGRSTALYAFVKPRR